VLVVNRHSTYRNTQLTLHATVEIMKNDSLHEVVFKIIFRKVHNELPDVMASHASSSDTECSLSYSEWNWRASRAECLKIFMC